jgi:hypothetical protein
MPVMQYVRARPAAAPGWAKDDDCSIECPYHAGKFDIRTGLSIALPCTEPIRAYRIDARDGILYLRPVLARPAPPVPPPPRPSRSTI